MKSILTTVWILGATLAGVAALLSGSPFDAGRMGLESLFATGPAWTQVQRLYVDPATQEVSHGENPSHSLGLLSRQWSDSPEARIVFVGNSQMFYMSLAPGEPAPRQLEKTYPDLIADNYTGSARCYRLAAPGMSYTEALWYAAYMTRSSRLRPTAMVLQMNYQSFWNGGVRDGMLDMLDDARFLEAIQQLAASGQAFAGDFTDALHRYARRKEQTRAAARAEQAKLELSGPVLANRMESALRQEMESNSLWEQRSRHRAGFYDLLYSARIYLLHLNPTTARSITGTRLVRSRASLRAIAELCRDSGVRLFLFSAPVNPNVSLYQTSADLERYRGILHELENEYQVPVDDLEHAIPAPLWGTWMNGPDPLHLGRQAHRRMASLMVEFLNSGLHRQESE